LRAKKEFGESFDGFFFVFGEPEIFLGFRISSPLFRVRVMMMGSLLGTGSPGRHVFRPEMG
jgi:hypothetical protein